MKNSALTRNGFLCHLNVKSNRFLVKLAHFLGIFSVGILFSSILLAHAEDISSPGPGMSNLKLPTVTYEQSQLAMSALSFPTNLNQGVTASDSSKSSKSSAISASSARVAGDNSSLAPASITELARSLKNNPDLIYEYVRNNIEFYPVWGVQKGALGALIDNQGTAYDQAMLMVELLRASGYTANYVQGAATFTAEQMKSWYGYDTANICGFLQILGNGQIPIKAATLSGPFTCPGSTSTIYDITIAHVWVKVNIGGTDYVFDPSYKPHTAIAGIDLATASGYNQANYLSSARSGAVIGTDTITGINRTNIRNNLTSYATTLANWLRTNKPTASLDDVLGGKSITPYTGANLRQTSLPYQSTAVAPTVVADVPASYKPTLQIRYQGIDQTYTSDAIYGKRLTISFVSNQPVLKVDGVQLGALGTAVNPGATSTITLTIKHNAYAQRILDQEITQQIQGGGTYLIANAWGPVGRGLSMGYRSALVKQKAAGVPDSDERVMGSSLGVLAGQWFAQTTFNSYTNGLLSGVAITEHHNVGIAGYYDSSYVDIPASSYGIASPVDDSNKENAAFVNIAMHASILESTSVQQTTATSAVSTVKLVDLAVQGGQPIYSAVSSNFASAVQPNLVGCASQLSLMQAYMNAGRRLILPQRCDIAEGNWKGTGYFALSTNRAGAIISGGMLGGFSSYPVTPAVTTYNSVAYTNSPSTLTTYSGRSYGDPIDMIKGGYLYTHDDISVGVGAFPQSLTFTRLYGSDLALQSGVLGNGWTHNFDANVLVASDGYQAMGEDSALDAVGSLIEQKISYDILASDAARPTDKIVIAALGQRWYGEQLTDNTVIVKQGLNAEVFVKLPDGSYNPPPGVSARLTLAGGVYTYETVNRAKLTFNQSTATNGANKIATYADPSGLRVNYAYTGANLASVSNSLGRALTFTTTSNRITKVEDGNSRSVANAYDSSGNLVTYTDSLLKNTTYEYDQPGRMTKLFYPSFPTTPALTNVYDTLDRIKTQTNAVSGLYTYYFAGTRSAEEGPGGKNLVNYLDNQGNVLKLIDSLGRVTLSTYDNQSRLIKKVLPGGNYTQYTYDDATCAAADKRCTHNIKTVVATPKPGSSLAALTQSFTYESAFNKVATITDARGKVTTSTYTSFGSPLKVTSPTDAAGNAPEVSYTYTAYTPTASGFTAYPFNLVTGTSVKTTASNTVTSAVAYQAADKNFVLANTVEDTGSGKLNLTTYYAFDAVGNRTVVNGPRTDVSDRTVMVYDAARQATDITDAAIKLTKLTYDADGRVTIKAQQLGSAWLVNCTTYSATGKPLKVWGPAQTSSATTCPGQAAPVAVTDYAYDTADRPITVTQNLPTAEGGNRVTQTNYNADDSILSVARGVGSSLAQTYASYTYNNNGKPITVKDAKNNLTTTGYDGFDRVYQVFYPNPSTANASSTTDYDQYGYDSNSNVTSIRKRNGNSISQTFDNLNRLIARSYPATANNLTFSYDLRGLRTATQYADGSNTITYTWDNAGRLLNTSSAGRTLNYEYDPAGNRTKTTWPDAYYTTTSYDIVNRPLSIQENGNVALASYAYDDLSRRTTTTLGNGTSTGYSYDTQANLSSIEHFLAGTTQDVKFSYSRNQAQAVTQTSISNNLYLWTGATTGTINYTSNGLNQYASVTSRAIGFDSSGNQNVNYDSQYTYDNDNRLLSQANPTLSSSFTYDANSRLRKTIIGGTETQLLYDDTDLVAEYDSTGAVTKRYVHGPGIDEPIVQYDGAGTANKSWFYADQQGSIVALANTTGAATATYTYGPYGEAGGTAGGRFRYTGQQYITQLNMLYYKARIYSTSLGRFLQPDPIGYDDDINLYAYVGNDPVNRTDPSGLCPSCAVGAVTSVLLGGAIRYATSGGDWGAVTDMRAIAVDAGLGAIGAGLVSKINTIRKFDEINQLSTVGRDLVSSGAAPKYTSSISQSLTSSESNQLGSKFVNQGQQYVYREPAFKASTQTVRSNFETTVVNSSGNAKAITNIHADITPYGTGINNGIAGGIGGSMSNFARPRK